MTQIRYTGDCLWARMERAVDRIRERLERATAVLDSAGIPYAIIGGNAVRVWVAQVDEAAVRTTRDVDILLRREDLSAAIEVMERAGFVFRHSKGIDMFLDGPEAKARDAVHVLLAGEKVRASDELPAPTVEESVVVGKYRTVMLDGLVRMKLNSFRRKDQMHLLDMLDVGLIDATWVNRFPEPLAGRLQELIDNPEE